MKEEILFKIHKSYRNTISICDLELYGKKFVEGIKQLDLTGRFYEGEKISIEESWSRVLDWAIEDATFNIVGNESISTALEAGIITKQGIITIDNIPIALILL